MTVTEYLRQRLLDSVGVMPDKPRTNLSPTEILDSEMDWNFLSEMAHGMIMGYFRYGKASESNKDNLAEAFKRLERYKNTGNQECLRDAANFIMQERRRPSVKGAYFKAVDDGEHAK